MLNEQQKSWITQVFSECQSTLDTTEHHTVARTISFVRYKAEGKTPFACVMLLVNRNGRGPKYAPDELVEVLCDYGSNYDLRSSWLRVGTRSAGDPSGILTGFEPQYDDQDGVTYGGFTRDSSRELRAIGREVEEFAASLLKDRKEENE